MNVCAVLAAYNEAKNLKKVVGPIVEQGYGCILVDDGSTDGTQELAEALGAKVVRHVSNLGQGWGVLTGFKAALAENCDVIVEMDADGQHDPHEISKFVLEMEKTGADIVVGSRILGSSHSDAPLLRRKFLPAFTYLVNLLTGYKMTDALCGFRAFNAKSLANASVVLDDMLEPQYIAAEMFIRFSTQNLTVSEVPIHLQNRISGKSYKGMVKYGWGIIRAIIQTLRDLDNRKSRK